MSGRFCDVRRSLEKFAQQNEIPGRVSMKSKSDVYFCKSNAIGSVPAAHLNVRMKTFGMAQEIAIAIV